MVFAFSHERRDAQIHPHPGPLPRGEGVFLRFHPAMRRSLPRGEGEMRGLRPPPAHGAL